MILLFSNSYQMIEIMYISAKVNKTSKNLIIDFTDLIKFSYTAWSWVDVVQLHKVLCKSLKYGFSSQMNSKIILFIDMFHTDSDRLIV